MRQSSRKESILSLLFVLSSITVGAGAQVDYPFRDPNLGDDERIADLQKRQTVDEKVELMDGHPKIPRLNLVLSDEAEGLHGLALSGPGQWGPRGRRPLPTTTFPQEKGLGETWDPALMKKIGALEGEEARYYYQNPIFAFGGIVVRAPNTDLSRDPRWGGTEEPLGEDPYLVGTMSVGFIQGIQGPDPNHRQAASLMKHFLANENENGRTRTSSDFDERLFREYYSVPFRMGFEQGGSRAVMASYNSCIGEWHYKRALFENHTYQRASLLIPLLVDIVSKNGNLLLNIPLPGHGEPDSDELAFLEELAQWQQINGEAIKGTRLWKIFGEGPSTEVKNAPAYQISKYKFDQTDIRFTTKGDVMYAIALG